MFGYSPLVVTTVGVSSALVLRNLYYTMTFNSLIERAKQDLEPLHLNDAKKTPISRQDMLSGSYEQLEDKHEFAFALKPGFEEEFKSIFGTETPFYHTCCAYAVVNNEGTKWLLYGRQSPRFRTHHEHEEKQPSLERKGSPLETKADNERHYTLLERQPADPSRKIYSLLRTGVYFSKSEIKEVIEKANRAICGNLHIRGGLNTFITSNCYTFSVFCLTEYIDILLNKHRQTGAENESILKLYKILLEVCTHPVLHGQGICNNGPVRKAVFETVDKIRQTILPERLLALQHELEEAEAPVSVFPAFDEETEVQSTPSLLTLRSGLKSCSSLNII